MVKPLIITIRVGMEWKFTYFRLMGQKQVLTCSASCCVLPITYLLGLKVLNVVKNEQQKRRRQE